MPGGGKGSTPAGNTTTTTNTQPWSQQIPYLLGGFERAADLGQNYTPQYFPGQTYATPTDAQGEGLGQIVNAGRQLAGTSLLPNTLGYTENLLTGATQGANPAWGALTGLATNNPGVNNAGSSTLSQFAGGNFGANNLDDVTNSVLAQVVPRIQSQFINGGSLGSPQAAYATSQGATAALAPLVYQQRLADIQTQANAASQLGQQNIAGAGVQAGAANNLGGLYNMGTQQGLTALGLLPQTLSSQFLPGQQEYSAGQTQQGLTQAAINDAIQRFNYGQTLPYQQLNQYLGEISGNYGSTGTTVSPFYQNQTANVLSGGLGGALAGSALLGPAGLAVASPGLAMALGGLLGVGSSLTPSDVRVKTDIAPFGSLDNGLNVYMFRYKGHDQPQIGLMAQEVEKVHPEAVYERKSDGLKLVDYAAAVKPAWGSLWAEAA